MGGQRSCNVDKLLKQEVMGGQSLHVIEKLPKLEMSGFQKSHNLDKPLKQEVIGGQRSRNVEKVLKQEMMGGQKPCDLNKPPKQDVIRGQRSHNLQEMLKQEMMGGQRSRNVEKVLKPEVIGDQKPCDLNKPPKQDVIRGQRSHNLQEMLKQEMMGGQRTHNMKKLLKQEGMGGQRSCGVEKLVKQEVMRGQRSCDVEKLLKQSQAELQWIQRQLSILSKRSLDHQLPTDRHGALHHSPDGAQLYGGAWGRGRGLLLQQQLDILLPRQVEESRITPQPVRDGAATWIHAFHGLAFSAALEVLTLTASRVKSEYDKIRKKFAIVTWERDSALQKNRELEDKLEKLEQVLKHMRDTAEQRYQLELDHEQALAILHKRQQEIDLLQKAQVQAKKEHEGTVHLLEDKVQELEQKCRSQSEQFSLLWKELEKFRLQAVVIDTAPAEAIRELDVHGPKDKLYSWLLSGLQPQTEKSDQSSVKFSVKSKLHLVDGNKTHLLSVKTSPPNTSRSSCLQRDSQSEMDEMESRTSRSKDRYTGKVRLCTARYSYNPYDGPNEHPEAELPLVAGSYLYVYGTMDDDGFYQGELLDGQRGLVPSNFVELVQDKADRSSVTTWGEEAPGWKPSAEGGENTAEALGVVKDEFGDEVVPYPRGITLIKQLAKSVIVGWDSALVPPGWGTLSAYDVLVGTEVRCRVLAGGRNKLLVEKLDLAAHTYRISVRSVTDKGSSDELRCTLLVGQGAVVAPCCLRVAGVSRDSADLAWMPSNSNYSHTVFLNGTEHREVGPACYQCRLRDLSPMTVYRVRIAARPHQVPWQLPLEQREKAEVSAEFCTQAAGPPFPPQEVQVQSGQFPGVLQVRWRTPELTTTGTSNGASVIGYAVCTKGQRIAEVLYPTADYMVVELNRIQTLEAGEIFVRTLSLQGESQDSAAATIPYHLLVPPHPPPQPQAHPLPPSEPRLQPAPRPESGAPETKEEEVRKVSNQDWGPPYSRSPLSPPLMSGHSLGAPPHLLGRSPSPQRILPQPRGAPIPDNVAKAMARQAAQRVAADSRMSHAVHQQNSDEEEEESVDGGDPVHSRRRGVSVDEFLRGSELGRQLHSSYSEEAQTDSSRGSDLSDIMEEEEEEDLRSEMQTEEGRRRSGVSHNTLKILGSPPTTGPLYRGSGRRPVYSISPVSVPAIEITTESNSDENQWTIKEAVYDDGVARTRIWPKPQGPASARRCDSNPVRHAPPCEAVSEPGDSWRIFVALFDYDPHTMSPNPNAVNEELCFKEGQIIKVYGDKDTDGFYRAELSDKMGLIPCNMVSEIQAEDGDVMDKLIKQGFLPLNTPVDKLERDSRSGEPLGFTRRMVALYDYDPRESSPNVDVEAELTFSAGDVITILRAIDEDGFYYGEMNGHRGLIPSNFLEEVPDDVEVYLTDTPRHAVSEATTVTPEEMVPAQRAASPSTPSTQPDCELARSVESPHDLSSKRKKGLLSKGKRLLKRLAVVK